MSEVIDNNEPAAGMIAGTTVSNICSARDAALSKMEEAAKLFEEAYATAQEAQNLATIAHNGAAFYDSQHHKADAYRRLFHHFSAKESLESWRRHVDARVWMALFERTGMDGLMDATAKDRLRKDLMGSVPEVSEDAVHQILGDLVADAKSIFQRGLAKCFSSLDRRFKSHDAFKLGSRIILDSAIGSWGLNLDVADTITDVERVFMVLDGDRKPVLGGLAAAISKDRGYDCKQTLTETDYFRVRTFKKGTVHLWFTRPDLVERANEVLADWYGEVLPDGVPVEQEIKPGTALSKDLAFYRTPPKTIHRAFRDAWRAGKILEPSAGDGAIVRWLLSGWERTYNRPNPYAPKKAPPKLSITAYEVHSGRSAQIDAIAATDSRVSSIHANFLRALPTGDFDQVLMNPPFAGTHYMDHVIHAWDFLRPGGQLIAILPITARTGQDSKRKKFRAWVDARKDYRSPWWDLPAESFAESGTNVNTTVLRLQKPRKPRTT